MTELQVQSSPVQSLLLKEGVLAYVIPLLLGYDTTLEEKEGGQPAFDASSDESQIGPKFLGLGIERSNMQVFRSHLERS